MTYIPTQEAEYEQSDIQTQMLNQLKMANLHLHALSKEEITEEDTE